MTFRHLPVTDLLDVTHNFEQLQAELALLAQPRPAGPTLVREQWKLLSSLGYENAWEDFEAGRKGEYRKNPFGTVELRGIIKTGLSGKSAFTLPVGYRPKAERSFLQLANGPGTAVIAIASTGVTTPTNVAGAKVETFVYLEATFSVE